jgi:hypothetical protein
MTVLLMAATAAALLSGAPASAQTAGSAPAWTWTLYEGEGPLVLANEVPDTPQLRTTLECEPGSGVARVSLYDVEASAGFAIARAGQATAAVEVRSARGRLQTALRTDHPVFAAFSASGQLMFQFADSEHAVEVGRAALPRLRRFAELCSG